MNSDAMDPNTDVTGISPKQQVVERVRAAANLLVTVRSNPSVDELSAAIGLTLMLNKLGKHATAVFSGAVPSTLEFLKPEETIETNTDSLRDFIVSLDKSKADKLRYKVEENTVKIFITPYRTSITEKDLEFTQGDFNVDVVLALGVSQREELDQAITAHGRILHDATVVTVAAGQRESNLGAINWQDPAASSLSEMLVSISEAFQGGLIDSQIATAFLTGIVSETERFSNPKTSPKVMTMAAQLMAAGANQQLIANELDKGVEVDFHAPAPAAAQPQARPVNTDGSLRIEHESSEENHAPAASIDELMDEAAKKQSEADLGREKEDFMSALAPSGTDESFNPLMPEGNQENKGGMPLLESDDKPHKDDESQIKIDDHGNILPPKTELKQRVIEPLSQEQHQALDDKNGNLEADLNAAIQQLSEKQPAPETPTQLETIVAPETTERAPEAPPMPEPMQEHKVVQPLPASEHEQKILPPMPELPADSAPEQLPDSTTLYEIEKTVHSPHIENPIGDPLEAAKNAVDHALKGAEPDPNRPEKNQNVGAEFGLEIHPPEPAEPAYPEIVTKPQFPSQQESAPPLEQSENIVQPDNAVGGPHRSLLGMDQNSMLPPLPSDDLPPVDPLSTGPANPFDSTTAPFDPTAPIQHDDMNDDPTQGSPPPIPPPLSFPQQ